MKDLRFIKINNDEIINFDVIKSIVYKDGNTYLNLKQKSDGFILIHDKNKAIFNRINNLLLK